MATTDGDDGSHPRDDGELLGSWDRRIRDRVNFLVVLALLVAALVVLRPTSVWVWLEFGVVGALTVLAALFPLLAREFASPVVPLGVLALLVGLEYLARPDDWGYALGFLGLLLLGLLARRLARASVS